MQTQRLPIVGIEGMSCSCSNKGSRYGSYQSYRQQPVSGACLLKQQKAKLSLYQNHTRQLNAVTALLTPAQRSQLESGNPLTNKSARPTNPYRSSSVGTSYGSSSSAVSKTYSYSS